MAHVLAGRMNDLGPRTKCGLELQRGVKQQRMPTRCANRGCRLLRFLLGMEGSTKAELCAQNAREGMIRHEGFEEG